MEISLGSIVPALDALGMFEGRTLAGLEPDDLIAAQRAAAHVRRASEAMLAAIAFEIGRRSTPELGASGLARGHGFSTPGRMIAQATGGSLSDAARLIDAGSAFATTPTPTASPQAAHPHLAGALARGEIGAEAAALLSRTLEKLGDQGPSLEQQLVARARNLDLVNLRRTCQRAEAHADPAAWEERERVQHEARHVAITEDADGMVRIHARLDPPTAAPVIAWLDAQVKDAFRRRREADPLTPDPRTVGQIRADVLASLFRHGAACHEPTSGISTTVVVRIGLDQLQSGEGVGSSDDVTSPLSASAIRMMSADAEVIPMIFGAQSELLDMGRARRLFSRAQRLALVERDGGCAMCHAPPSYCEAHHIRWWDRHRGTTNLSNGVLLCTGCHHRVHRDGWQVDTVDAQVWITPPRAIDPTQKRRLGGRARIQLAA